MREVFLTLMTCCALISASAQQVLFSITNSFQDDEGINLVRSDSLLFFAFNGNDYYQAPSTRARIIKLKEDGTFIKQVTLFGNDSIRSYINVLEIRNDSVFCIGNRTYGTDSATNTLFILDLELNFISSFKMAKIGDLVLPFVTGLTLKGNTLAIVGYSIDSIVPPRSFLELRKLDNLNIPHKQRIRKANLYFGINLYNENKFTLTEGAGKYYFIDSNLATIDSFLINQNTNWFVLGSYNLGSKTIMLGQRNYPRIDVLNSDTITNRIDSLPQSLPPGYNIPQNRPGTYAFDCFDSTFCYYGTTHNWEKPYLENTPMWITIYRLNLDGTLAWYKHFGGDANYQLFTLTTASDSGCFFIANRYDWTTQFNERDMYIYKIDKNGSMLGQEEFGGLRQINALVYPNPFSSSLTLEMLGQHDGVCKINVLATDGRVVANHTFDGALATKTNIDLAHLPEALYYLKVFDAQGAVLHQQKIIKQ